MFKEYKIIDDIISKKNQDILVDYVKNPEIKWEYTNDITGTFGDPSGKRLFPANVLQPENIEQHVLKIIYEIQQNVCSSLGFKYLTTYRTKINHTQPLNREYNPKDLIHVDMKMEHIAVVYYINDSDGDTVLLNNINGIGMDEVFKHSSGVKKENFTTMISINPKKGRAVVFYGNFYHYGDYPKLGDRFVVNIDLAIKDKTHTGLI